MGTLNPRAGPARKKFYTYRNMLETKRQQLYQPRKRWRTRSKVLLLGGGKREEEGEERGKKQRKRGIPGQCPLLN